MNEKKCVSCGLSFKNGVELPSSTSKPPPTRIPTLQNKHPTCSPGNCPRTPLEKKPEESVQNTKYCKKCTESPKTYAPDKLFKEDISPKGCHCLKQNQNTRTENKIFLPEVTVDIEPKCTQTIQIDVTPTKFDANESGTITIPVQLRFCRSNKIQVTTVESRQVDETTKPESPRQKLLFESCVRNNYYEQYMEDLILEDDPKELTSFNSAPKYKTEIIGMKKVPWYEMVDHENYIEPYLRDGYCASTDNVEVQTDLVLGDQLLSESLNSVPENVSRIEQIEEDSIKNVPSERKPFPWNGLLLPPTGTLEITPVEKRPKLESEKLDAVPFEVSETEPVSTKAESPEAKKKKKKKLSACCKGEDEPEEPYQPAPPPIPPPLPPEPLPEKISFVFGDMCIRNEPYMKSLLRYFPREEPFDSPCTSKPEIPWTKIVLPEDMQIRKLEKFQFVKVPINSTSAPCLCKKTKKQVDLQDENKSNSHSNFIQKNIPKSNLCPYVSKENSATKDIVTCSKSNVISPGLVPCPYLSKLNNYGTFNFKPKPFGNDNVYKTQIPIPNCSKLVCPALNKNSPFSVKTHFIAEGNDTKSNMSTKVIFKGQTETLCNSSWKIKSEESSNLNSEPITCKCLNKNAPKPFENSQSIPTENAYKKCTKDNCDRERQGTANEEKKSSSSLAYKQDPVILAFRACEAELRPFKEELNKVQQKLKNLNMPELDCIFHKEDDSVVNKASRFCKNETRQEPSKITTIYDYKTTKIQNHQEYSSRKNVFKADNQTFITGNTFNPNHLPPQLPPYPINKFESQQQMYYPNPNPVENYYQHYIQPYNFVQNYPSSNSSVDKTPTKRNKGIQKTGDYKHKRKCTHFCDYESSETNSKTSTGSSYPCSSAASENLIIPCPASTPSKLAKCQRSNQKRIKSMVSFAKESESICPFLEAMKSILLVDDKKVTKKGQNISYETKFLTKQMKNMKLRLRIRPSTTKK